VVALAATCLMTAVAATARGALAIPCDLTLKFGKRVAEPGSNQFKVTLVFINDSGVVCRVSGFPDVELIGPVYPMFGSIFELPRQVLKGEAFTLRSGSRAHATLTCLPSSGRADRWLPGYIRVVVPTTTGPSFAMALPWRYGPVLRQDGATHPGTYIGPVRRGPG
jgi:hypothetical protein